MEVMIQSKRKGDVWIIMIWEEYRINYLSTKYNYILSCFRIDTTTSEKVYIYSTFTAHTNSSVVSRSVVLPCGRNLSCYVKAKQFIDDY